MALNYRGTHHRNPSGLHAKVMWMYQRSCGDIDSVNEITNELTYELSQKKKHKKIDSKICQKAMESWHTVWIIFKSLFDDTEEISEETIKNNMKDSYNSYWYKTFKDWVLNSWKPVTKRLEEFEKLNKTK